MEKPGSMTPSDLRHQVFKKTWRGDDPREVAAVLEEVAVGWENLIAEHLRLQERNAALETQVKKYADLEQTLRDTLVVARKAAEDEAEAARRQAEVIRGQARVKAETIVQEAEARAQEARRLVHDLQVARSRLAAEMRAVMQSFTEQIDRFAGKANERYARATLREARSPGPERSSGIPPAQALEIAPRPERQPGGDEPTSDFDASLSKILGDEEAEVTVRKDPLFSDDGLFDRPSSPAEESDEAPPGGLRPGLDDKEQNW